MGRVDAGACGRWGGGGGGSTGPTDGQIITMKLAVACSHYISGPASGFWSTDGHTWYSLARIDTSGTNSTFYRLYR